MLALARPVEANHYQGSQTWNDCGASLGCIGWKYFSPTPPEINYIRANPLTDGSAAASAFSSALSYWDYSAGTVAWFFMNATPQNYPAARLVPYRLTNGPLELPLRKSPTTRTAPSAPSTPASTTAGDQPEEPPIPATTSPR